MNRRHKSRRLLLVVPHTERREIMAAVLGDAGFEVDSAGEVEEALERIRAELPTVVVADITPGREDSFELLHAVRESDDGSMAELPVVISAGRNRDVDRVRAWELGCDGFVPRPHFMTELLDALDEVLSLDASELARRREALFQGVRRQVAEKRGERRQ